MQQGAGPVCELRWHAKRLAEAPRAELLRLMEAERQRELLKEDGGGEVCGVSERRIGSELGDVHQPERATHVEQHVARLELTMLMHAQRPPRAHPGRRRRHRHLDGSVSSRKRADCREWRVVAMVPVGEAGMERGRGGRGGGQGLVRRRRRPLWRASRRRPRAVSWRISIAVRPPAKISLDLAPPRRRLARSSARRQHRPRAARRGEPCNARRCRTRRANAASTRLPTWPRLGARRRAARSVHARLRSVHSSATPCGLPGAAWMSSSDAQRCWSRVGGGGCER